MIILQEDEEESYFPNQDVDHKFSCGECGASLTGEIHEILEYEFDK